MHIYEILREKIIQIDKASCTDENKHILKQHSPYKLLRMSDIPDEETNSISRSSELDELENGYESNDTDSLNLDYEEEDDGNSFSLPCMSDRLVGGRVVLHIDQTGPPLSAPGCIARGDILCNHSASTATSLSDTASDAISTRAVMGDTPSTTETNAPGDEDAADNSSQASIADSEAERVRRIHNSIFSSLENDLAELVRIREETIQFLETGVRSGESVSRGVLSEIGSGDRDTTGAGEESSPFTLRERLTYYARPVTTSGDLPQGNSDPDVDGAATTTNEGNKFLKNAAIQAHSYTPIANFDNAPPAKPAKPYLETGLASCDEKAAAARKILDKLQYGDPEDETACFVRRFWRETSTVVDSSQTAPLSLDVAALAQRTASLQASLEEAFDGLRLRLQQAQTDPTTPRSDANDGNSVTGERSCRERENESQQTARTSNNTDENECYRRWEEDTSIMNNPLNYDIWNELEEGNEAGPIITARINMAERRALATSRNRQVGQRQLDAPSNNQQLPIATSTIAVGPDSTGQMEGAELDDDSTDDEEMMSYFRRRCNDISNSNASTDRADRPCILPRTFSQESRAFFQDIGISEEMGQDLFNMFTISEQDVQLPANLHLESGNAEMRSSEIPDPLFPRDNHPNSNVDGDNHNLSLNDTTTLSVNEGENDEQSESCSTPPPRIPLFDTTACIQINPNREDNCSMRVYLDENYLNFPIHPHNQEEPHEE